MSDLIRQLREYKLLALRTANPEAPLEYYWFGLLGELGELFNAYKKLRWHDKPLFEEDLLEEVGDVMWYSIVLLSKQSDDEVAFNSGLRLASAWVAHDFNRANGLDARMKDLMRVVFDGAHLLTQTEYLAHVITATIGVIGTTEKDVGYVLRQNIAKLRKRFPDGYVEYAKRSDLVVDGDEG